VKGDRVVVRYDIGALAGLRLSDPKDRKQCVFYEERRVNGQAARYCFGTGTAIVVFPGTYANFWAYYQDEKELAELMTMLSTYPSPRKAPPSSR
jgi:hypothetical protein